MACACQQLVAPPVPRTRIRVVVADADASRRSAYRGAVLETGGYELIAEAGSASELAKIVAAEEPELVIGNLPLHLRTDVADRPFPLCIVVGAAIVASPARTVATLSEQLAPAAIADALEAATVRILNAKASELSTLIRQYLLHSDMPVIQPLMMEVERDGARTEIDPGAVAWIRASGNYVRLHTSSGVYRMRSSMRSVATRLERLGFVRIHRARLVNAKSVQSHVVHDDGAIELVLHDGTQLPVGPTYRDLVLNRGLISARQ